MNWYERIDRAERHGGMPSDLTLRHFGLEFADAIHCNDIPAARRLLNLIEKRAGEILAEMKER